MSYAITIDEIDDSLDRVPKLLAGIPDGVYRAVGSALKRSARHGLTVGMTIIADGKSVIPGVPVSVPELAAAQGAESSGQAGGAP